LPSSGKSSIINSLCFKRIQQTGICRTTTEYKLIDDTLIDDANNKFKVIDLPGICDSEENIKSSEDFNELTYAHITNATLIIWTSDINKAFITTHEVEEFNNIKKYIKEREESTGELYYIIIMLSKCDKLYSIKKEKKEFIKTNNDEIEDSDEETNINDVIDKVKQKFPNDVILLFNAFGRSYHNKNSSATLKKFIEKTFNGIPTNHNINFDISNYTKKHNIEQQKLYYNHFLKSFEDFVNDKITIDTLKEKWNKVNDKDKYTIITEICQLKELEKNILTSRHVKIYEYIIMICYMNKKYETDCIINKILIYIYIYLICNISQYIINPEKIEYEYDNLSMDYFIHNSYSSFVSDANTNKIINIYIIRYQCIFIDKLFISLCNEFSQIISNQYDLMNNNSYIDLIDYLIFSPHITQITGIIFLLSIYHYELSSISNNSHFKLLFNNMINNNNSDYPMIFNKLEKFLNSGYITKLNDCSYDKYIEFLKDIIKCDYTILLYKLKIIKLILNNQIYYDNANIASNPFYALYKELMHPKIPYHRLKNNTECDNLLNAFWLKVYSNIKIEYNRSIFEYFVPISIEELLYKIIDEEDNDEDED
jgi:hypothetical protein